MTFRDYYRKLRKQERPLHPARAFIIRIAELTGRSPRTVVQWVCGKQQPPKDICIQIGEELNIAPEDLFP